MSDPYPPYQPGSSTPPIGGGYLPGGYQPQTGNGIPLAGGSLPSGAPNPYGPPPPQSDPNVSAIVLTCISAVLTLSFYCSCIGIAPLILGILGIVKQSTDPAGAARLTKIGWVVLGVLVLLTLLAVIGLFGWTLTQDTTTYGETY